MCKHYYYYDYYYFNCQHHHHHQNNTSFSLIQHNMSAVLKFIIIIIIIIHASFLFNTTQYLYTNKRNEGDVKEITIGCLSCHTVKDVPLRSLRTTAHRRQLTGQHGATMEIKRYKISKSGSLLARSKLSAVGLSFHLISSCLIYPLSARVVGAPQMISQPVSSIFPCSPMLSGTWRTPGLSIP